MLKKFELKMNVIALGFEILLIAVAVISLPIDRVEITEKELMYLSRLGYYKKISSEISSMHNEKEIRDSIETLQKFAGLPVSGILDEPTQKLIETPRCGMPDITQPEDKRKRRFSHKGTPWKKSELTWKLLNNNNDGLSREAVETTLHKAFLMWEAVTNLKFRKLTLNNIKTSDIDVKFAENYHNCSYPFDGVGSTLAHAFFPNNIEGVAGDIHFDDAEKYTIDSPNGHSLLWIAVHEIGHSLGLDHSKVKNALMFPWYVYEGNNIQLNEDDVLGIQSLYGSKVTKSHQTKSKSYQIKAAIYEQSTGITYAFNKEKYYKISKDLKKTDGPYLVAGIFSNIGSVDTGYMNSEKKLIFFNGTRYYMYESFSNPKLFETGSIFNKFKGISNNIKKIDAAFVWSNRKTYIFTGDEYYRLNETNNVEDKSFPRKIKGHWLGIPAAIDSVFVWKDGATYFFKDSMFYRVDSKGHLMKDYPKDISGSWLNY